MSTKKIGIVDNDNQEIEIDDRSGALIIIDEDHSMIHDGKVYTYTEHQIIGDGESRELLITAPISSAVFCHMSFSVRGQLDTTVHIYEDSDHSLGPELPSVNRDRNSSNNAETKVYISERDGYDGSPQIFDTSFGNDSGVGANATRHPGESRGDCRYILKTGFTYLLKVESGSANNKISIHLDWQENG